VAQERQPIKASIAFTSTNVPFPAYRKDEIHKAVNPNLIIGCRSPAAGETRACGIGSLPLVYRELAPT